MLPRCNLRPNMEIKLTPEKEAAARKWLVRQLAKRAVRILKEDQLEQRRREDQPNARHQEGGSSCST